MLQSDIAIPECHSDQQSVVGDFPQNAAPSHHFSSGTGNGLGAMLPEEGPDEELVHQEVDRKSIHVLVVEDKYVVNPCHACSCA